MDLPAIFRRARAAFRTSALRVSPAYGERVCNRYWASKREHSDTSDRAFDYYYAQIAAIVAPRLGDRILDFGCGGGEIAARFRRDGFDVVGTDISARLLKRAQAFGVPTIAWASTARLRANAPVFDAIFANNVLLYTSTPDGARAPSRSCAACSRRAESSSCSTSPITPSAIALLLARFGMRLLAQRPCTLLRWRLSSRARAT